MAPKKPPHGSSRDRSTSKDKPKSIPQIQPKAGPRGRASSVTSATVSSSMRTSSRVSRPRTEKASVAASQSQPEIEFPPGTFSDDETGDKELKSAGDDDVMEVSPGASGDSAVVVRSEPHMSEESISSENPDSQIPNPDEVINPHLSRGLSDPKLAETATGLASGEAEAVPSPTPTQPMIVSIASDGTGSPAGVGDSVAAPGSTRPSSPSIMAEPPVFHTPGTIGRPAPPWDEEDREAILEQLRIKTMLVAQLQETSHRSSLAATTRVRELISELQQAEGAVERVSDLEGELAQSELQVSSVVKERAASVSNLETELAQSEQQVATAAMERDVITQNTSKVIDQLRSELSESQAMLARVPDSQPEAEGLQLRLQATTSELAEGVEEYEECRHLLRQAARSASTREAQYDADMTLLRSELREAEDKVVFSPSPKRPTRDEIMLAESLKEREMLNDFEPRIESLQDQVLQTRTRVERELQESTQLREARDTAESKLEALQVLESESTKAVELTREATGLLKQREDEVEELKTKASFATTDLHESRKQLEYEKAANLRLEGITSNLQLAQAHSQTVIEDLKANVRAEQGENANLKIRVGDSSKQLAESQARVRQLEEHVTTTQVYLKQLQDSAATDANSEDDDEGEEEGEDEEGGDEDEQDGDEWPGVTYVPYDTRLVPPPDFWPKASAQSDTDISTPQAPKAQVAMKVEPKAASPPERVNVGDAAPPAVGQDVYHAAIIDLATHCKTLVEDTRAERKVKEEQDEKKRDEARELKQLERPRHPSEVKPREFKSLPKYESPGAGVQAELYYFEEVWLPLVVREIHNVYSYEGPVYTDKLVHDVMGKWNEYLKANIAHHKGLQAKRIENKAKLVEWGLGGVAAEAAERQAAEDPDDKPVDGFYPRTWSNVRSARMGDLYRDDASGFQVSSYVLARIETEIYDYWAPGFKEKYKPDEPKLKAIFGNDRPFGSFGDMLFHKLVKLCPGYINMDIEWPQKLETAQQSVGETTLEFFDRYKAMRRRCLDLGFKFTSVQPSYALVLRVMKQPVATMTKTRQDIWDKDKVRDRFIQQRIGSDAPAWDEFDSFVEEAVKFVTDFDANVVKAKAKAEAKTKGLAAGKADPKSKDGPKGKTSGGKSPKDGKGGGPKDGAAMPKFVLAKWLPKSAEPPKLAGGRKLRPPRETTSVVGGKRELDLIDGVNECFGWHGTDKDRNKKEKFCQYGAACGWKHTTPEKGRCWVCHAADCSKANCPRPGGDKFEGPMFPPSGYLFEIDPSDAVAIKAMKAIAKDGKPDPKRKGKKGPKDKTKPEIPKKGEAKRERNAFVTSVMKMNDDVLRQHALDRGVFPELSAYVAPATAPAVVPQPPQVAPQQPQAAPSQVGGNVHAVADDSASLASTVLHQGYTAGMSLPPTMQAVPEVPVPVYAAQQQAVISAQQPATAPTIQQAPAKKSAKQARANLNAMLANGQKVLQPQEPYKPGARVAIALASTVEGDDVIPDGAWVFDPAASECFRNREDGEDTSGYDTCKMGGANAHECTVPVDPRRDLIVEGEQLLPGGRMAARNVVTSIFLQGHKRAFIDRLSKEDAAAILRILEKGKYKRALLRNHLSYVDQETGRTYAEDLRVAEGRVANTGKTWKTPARITPSSPPAKPTVYGDPRSGEQWIQTPCPTPPEAYIMPVADVAKSSPTESSDPTSTKK